ncbi:MAG: hypothetical protein J7K23_04615 [Thermoproteales archaeon]|nr:hypothetical protein [Thermoproteales archaeon]
MNKSLGILEKIELLIPGFRGYKQKELIREDDALVRRKVAGLLDESRQNLEQFLLYIKRKDIDLALRLDDLRLELMKASQMIRHAPYGYASLYSRVRIKENELQQILQHDYQLITQAEEVYNLVNGLFDVTETSEILKKANEIWEKLMRIEQEIRYRNNMFKMER